VFYSSVDADGGTVQLKVAPNALSAAFKGGESSEVRRVGEQLRMFAAPQNLGQASLEKEWELLIPRAELITAALRAKLRKHTSGV
jgi:hypothetical protein